MKYRYYVIPPAREEMRLARQWYKQLQVSGLSDRFALAVKDTILRIQQNPFAFSIRYKNVRIAHTNNFPYAVHFYVDDNTIIITAIIFQGRDPMISKKRTQD